MSLIICPDCKREISNAAFTCPQCGRPNKTNRRKLPNIRLYKRLTETPATDDAKKIVVVNENRTGWTGFSNVLGITFGFICIYIGLVVFGLNAFGLAIMLFGLFSIVMAFF